MLANKNLKNGEKDGSERNTGWSCEMDTVEIWLSDRTQRVCIHGVTSKESPGDSGVPQGSSLFTVYIDDLELACQLDLTVVKFACDTKGGKVIVNTEDRDKLKQALDGLCDWADKWGMSFNLARFKVMHVGIHNPAYEYFMRGVKLEEKEKKLAWR
jgi:hypothetical protein